MHLPLSHMAFIATEAERKLSFALLTPAKSYPYSLNNLPFFSLSELEN
jgi:hypothetical protein